MLDPYQPSLFPVKSTTKTTVKVETENEDEALDCSVTSRSAEKHSLDGTVTCLQDSSKRKQTSLGCDGSGSQQDVLPSVKKRRFAQEVTPLCLTLGFGCRCFAGCCKQSASPLTRFAVAKSFEANTANLNPVCRLYLSECVFT